MAILLACESVDYFIQRAVASARDDELASFGGGSLRHCCGVAGRSRLLKVGLYARQGKNAPGLVEHAPAAAAAIAGVRVVNQQSVAKVWQHRPSRARPSRAAKPPFYI